MGKLHMFLSATGGVYLVLVLAERFLAKRDKTGNRKISASANKESTDTNKGSANKEISFEKTKNKSFRLKKTRLLLSRASLAAGMVYFGVSLFTKSINLIVIGFLMILFSSVMSIIINDEQN